MKNRQKQILRLLLANDSTVRIDDIASALSVGSRTVSRDLDYLGKWLSIRGVHMERKTSQGIRILNYGKNAKEIIAGINSSGSSMPDLESEERQKFIFLYLLYNNREIKISEIAHTFFVSDTCVWNDLNNIEIMAEKNSLSLLRLKGVGIRINGEESNARFYFLQLFSDIFSHKTIISYLYSENYNKIESPEKYKLDLLVKHYKFPENKSNVFQLVQMAEQKLGYRFTMSGEAFLYFYLILSEHRIKSGALINSPPGSLCNKQYRETAYALLEVLTRKIISGSVPEHEIEVLGIILQVLEIGDFSPEKTGDIGSLITEEASAFSRKLIAALEQVDNEFYYLDSDFETLMGFSAASLILRLQNKIPYWHDDCSREFSTDSKNRITEKTIVDLLKTELGLEARAADIQHLLFHFSAASIKNHTYQKRKTRCIIFCFEGIGLASYLYSIIKREITDVDVVESTAVNKFDQEYLDRHQIDLVISTFQINSIKTPAVLVSLPVDREILAKNISHAIKKIRHEKDKTDIYGKIQNEAKIPLSIDALLSFIQQFCLIESEKPEPAEKTVKTISRKINHNPGPARNIEKAFLEREKLGPLFFEEFGIKMLHCKSRAVAKPFAGVIRYRYPEYPVKLVVFLAAPDPCPEEIRKVLSEITIAIMENQTFRETLFKGNIETIHKNLLDIYRHLL